MQDNKRNDYVTRCNVKNSVQCKNANACSSSRENPLSTQLLHLNLEVGVWRRHADQIVDSITASSANRLRNADVATQSLSLTHILPEEKLVVLIRRVAQAEERVLAARVDLASLEVLGAVADDGVIGGAFEVQGAAVGGEDAEGDGVDVFAVVLSLVEVFDGEGGVVAAAGLRGGGGEAEDGGGGGEVEFHCCWWLVLVV